MTAKKHHYDTVLHATGYGKPWKALLRLERWVIQYYKCLQAAYSDQQTIK